MYKRVLLAAALAAAAVVRPAPAALSTTNSVQTFTSNGVQTAFATGYRFLDNSHLVVQKTVSGVTTTLNLGTDFSVTGANAQAGGTVTLVAAIPNGATLTIKRSTPRTQTCSLRTVSNQTTAAIENCLDRVTMILQEMNDGTFTQLLATPVTTAQATTAAPSTIPNSSNTNVEGSSSAFARADHLHALAVGPMLTATTTAGQSIPSGAPTIVVYGTVGTDTDSAYNSGTGRFTVPAGKGGHYSVSCSVLWNASAGTAPNIGIYVNAVGTFNTQWNQSGTTGMSVSATVNVTAGQIIDCRVTQVSGGAVVLSSSGPFNFITIKRIQ